MVVALMPAPAALAQTAAGYAIQLGRTVSNGAPPAIKPPSTFGENSAQAAAAPATTAAKTHHTRHEKIVDDSRRADDDQSSPTDSWIEVK